MDTGLIVTKMVEFTAEGGNEIIVEVKEKSYMQVDTSFREFSINKISKAKVNGNSG